MNRILASVSAGTLALVLSSGAFAATPSPVSPAQIEAARTPADHEAIAAAYDKEAARLEAMAKEHEKMAHSYQAITSKAGPESASMHAHCAKLAKKYSDAAEENRELARQHRAMMQHAGHQM